MKNIIYEVWWQNQDKLVTQCTIVLIRKKYRVNKIHIGLASPDMNFIDPILFHIRTIVHCVSNNVPRIYTIHIREYRRGNHKWTIQRNWQHRVHNMLETAIRKQTQTTQYDMSPDTIPRSLHVKLMISS